MALTRSALARLAAACSLTPAVMTQAATPTAADEPALVQSCLTTALPHEEIEAGAISEITCEWVEPGEWVGTMFRSSTLAIHYAGPDGSGDALVVGGDCAGGVAFGPGHAWNNAVSSTQHFACGTVKHFDSASYSGDFYVTNGWPGLTLNLGPLNNRASSIGYAL